MINKKVIANNFIQLRKTFKLSQIEFAECCNLSNDDVIKIEHGNKKISPDELIHIASALNFNPCDLLLFISSERH